MVRRDPRIRVSTFYRCCLRLAQWQEHLHERSASQDDRNIAQVKPPTVKDYVIRNENLGRQRLDQL